MVWRGTDDLFLRRVYFARGVAILDLVERWAYHSSLDLEKLLKRGGYAVERQDRGYAAGVSPHRRLILARKT